MHGWGGFVSFVDGQGILFGKRIGSSHQVVKAGRAGSVQAVIDVHLYFTVFVVMVENRKYEKK